MSQVKRKHQFQIRKVPLKRFIPEKTPELYALDVHSICLPSKGKNKHNWASLHNDPHTHNFEEDFNQQIVSSKAYKELYSYYIQLRDERAREKTELQSEIQKIEQMIQHEKDEHHRLTGIRDNLYTDIEGLRDQLTECRDKNYNLRWEVYNQRGTQYANLYGYSFLEPNQLTYEQLLQMQEQIGSVNRGLSLDEIQQLDKKMYVGEEGGDRQICCICYDEIQDSQWVTVLKCSHTHHCDCIKDWLVKQKICPICKKQVIIEAKPVGDQIKPSREEVELAVQSPELNPEGDN